MYRIVKAELLDELSPADPRAIRSRSDLRRLNFLMGHGGILARAFRLQFDFPNLPSRPLRVIELGAGDGTLLLRLARVWSSLGMKAEVIFLDRQNLISEETRRAFASLNWTIDIRTADAFSWLESASLHVDLILANLFLHHFPDGRLCPLLKRVAAKTDFFLACEPCRSPLALTAARMLGLIGCNGITRHDAVVSVRAGFVDHELTALWPKSSEWKTNEQTAGLFSHLFVAKRSA